MTRNVFRAVFERPTGQHGFSLAELLVAMMITVGISGLVFHLFLQNARVFQDQSVIMEAQQAARVAISETADEIRMAGQGVPVFSASYDTSPSEGVVTFLSGCTASRLNLRSGRSGIESTVTSATPVALAQGVSVTLTIADATPFSGAIGTTPSGRFVYVWGMGSNGWGWVRAAVSSIASATNTIRLTPVEIGGGLASLQFTATPTITLEEAVTLYRDGPTASLRRATATNMTNPTAPGWSPANELASNVTGFTLSYYDREGVELTPDTLIRRAAIARVDVHITVQVESPLSNRSQPAYTFSVRSVPRNLKIL